MGSQAPGIGEGTFLGMLKYRDVIKAAQANKSHQLVKAWMRRDVLTCAADTPLDEIEAIFVDMHATGRLPVVDEDGTLLGLVTRTGVLRQHRLYGDMGRAGRSLAPSAGAGAAIFGD